MAAKLRRELFEAGIDSGQEDDTAKEIAVMVAMEAFRRLKRERDEARGERDARVLHEFRFHARCESPFKAPETPEEHAVVEEYWRNY